MTPESRKQLLEDWQRFQSLLGEGSRTDCGDCTIWQAHWDRGVGRVMKAPTTTGSAICPTSTRRSGQAAPAGRVAKVVELQRQRRQDFAAGRAVRWATPPSPPRPGFPTSRPTMPRRSASGFCHAVRAATCGGPPPGRQTVGCPVRLSMNRRMRRNRSEDADRLAHGQPETGSAAGRERPRLLLAVLKEPLQRQPTRLESAAELAQKWAARVVFHFFAYQRRFAT